MKLCSGTEDDEVIQITFITPGDVPPIIITTSTFNGSQLVTNTTTSPIVSVEKVKGYAGFVAEVQRIDLSPSVNAGGFLLPTDVTHDRISSELAAYFPWNATAEEIMTASLPGIASVHRLNLNPVGGSSSISWIVEFGISGGPQSVLWSPCMTAGQIGSTDACDLGVLQTLEEEVVYPLMTIHRVRRGYRPVSGNFSLGLETVKAGERNILPPLDFYSSEDDVRNVITNIYPDAQITTSPLPYKEGQHGSIWTVRFTSGVKMAIEYGGNEKLYTLHSTHELMCVEEAEGPPCDFPTIHADIPVSDVDRRSRHECLLGEWCRNLYTSMVGTCTPCAQSNNSSWAHSLEPSVYVATPLQTVRLRGTIEDLITPISETMYKPLLNWNSAVHGYDAVVANGFATYVLVAPVNDPPVITLANTIIHAKEGEDPLITGIVVWDDDIGDNCDANNQRRWWVGNNTLYPEHEPVVVNTNVSGLMPTTTTMNEAAVNVELEIEVEHGSVYLNYTTGLELIGQLPCGMNVKSVVSICNA